MGVQDARIEKRNLRPRREKGVPAGTRPDVVACDAVCHSVCGGVADVLYGPDVLARVVQVPLEVEVVVIGGEEERSFGLRLSDDDPGEVRQTLAKLLDVQLNPHEAYRVVVRHVDKLDFVAEPVERALGEMAEVCRNGTEGLRSVVLKVPQKLDPFLRYNGIPQRGLEVGPLTLVVAREGDDTWFEADGDVDLGMN